MGNAISDTGHKRHKVLILAGGGLWGAIPVYFLSCLGKDYDFQSKIDTIAGTSIGGIETCCLSIGAKAEDILDAFLVGAEDIFTKRWVGKLNPLTVPTYDSEALSSFTEKFVNGYTIGDIKTKYPNLSFFVPCLNMTSNKVKVFDNVTGQDDSFKLLDVALCTSAAPTYFQVRNIKGDAITDGGVRENIPVITTATGVKSKLNIDFSDMDVLVICTGQVIDQKCGGYDKVSKWNLLDWALKFIVPDVTNSNESMSKFWGEHIGFHDFQLFNPVQIRGDMDDADNLDYMLTEAKMYKNQFLKVWERFIS